VVGALGQVDAHASGVTGTTATFDYGDSTAADVQDVTDGEADSEHTYTANGTFTITVTDDDSEGTTTATVADLAALEFDPADHTVPEVQAYVTDNPDSVDDVRALEADGKARTTLLAWLDALDDGDTP
jgi:hypothetical protein